MFMPNMVVEIVRHVKRTMKVRNRGLVDALAHWTPRVLEDDQFAALMKYYMPSNAIVPLLEQLRETQTIPAPTEAMVVAAGAHIYDWCSPINMALTLYYEGLLTHAAVAVEAAATSWLRVPNNYIQRNYIERVGKHLTQAGDLSVALLRFITHREFGRLQEAMGNNVSRPLNAKFARDWREWMARDMLCSKLNTVSDKTHVSWKTEVVTPRISETGWLRTREGGVDVAGTTADGKKNTHIELKQLNLLYDIMRHREDRGNDERVLETAAIWDTLSEEELFALRLHPNSIKVTKYDAALGPEPETVGDVVAAAVKQAQDYARGWIWRNANNPGAELDVFILITFGPTRWVMRYVGQYRIPIPVLPAGRGGGGGSSGGSARPDVSVVDSSVGAVHDRVPTPPFLPPPPPPPPPPHSLPSPTAGEALAPATLATRPALHMPVSAVSSSLLRPAAAPLSRATSTVCRPAAEGELGRGGGPAALPPPPPPSSSSFVAARPPSHQAPLTNIFTSGGSALSSAATAGPEARREPTVPVLAGSLGSFTAARVDGDMGDAPAATPSAAAAVQVPGNAEPGSAGTAPPGT